MFSANFVVQSSPLAPFSPVGAITLFLMGIILLTGLLFYFLPELSRHDIFFSVTVDPAGRRTDEAKEILRRFRIAVAIHSFIGLVIAVTGISARHFALPVLGILWQVFGTIFAFLRARKRVLPHAAPPSSIREAALVRRAPGAGYWLLQLGPFAILAACAAYLQTNWRGIPARFPVHWGLNGKPNGWSTRSFSGVFGPLFVGGGACVFLALLSYGVTHWTRHIRSTGPQAVAETRFRRVQVGAFFAVQYFFACAFSAVPFMALRPHPGQAPSIAPFLLGTFTFVLVLYLVLIHTGQGGANLAKAGNGSAIFAAVSPVGERTPDECWRAGMFYVNPKDPALLVEKRFGIGYTLNFGRPAAWFLAAFILAMVIVPLVWL